MRNSFWVLIAVIAAYLALVQGCSKKPDQTNAVPAKNSIAGEWFLNKWTFYTRLSFYGDSTAAIDNHIDTIYWVRYAVEGDTLVLTSNDTVISTSKIMYLSADSLVL